MRITADMPYLVFPVSYTAVHKRLEFWEGDTLVYDLNIPLDGLHPDYETAIPMGRFIGRELTLRVEPSIEDIPVRAAASDDLPRDTRLRPRFHYTAKQGWINDPNGLCVIDGVYHLFYQYNPAYREWGNMHWGHAVSTDLVHWSEREPALYPDELGTMHSGSAVVDWDNRSGLGDGSRPPLLLFYTAAGGAGALSSGQPTTQCLAYSTDGGQTFQKYAGNPILPHIVGENRDPKVVYHPESGRYVLALFLDKHDYGLFTSDNLLTWSLRQVITLDEDWECPDFYPLPLDGDPARQKWVLIGAYDRYLVGSFDGCCFRAEQSAERLHTGNASYAAQTWFNLPEGDSRRVRIGWNNHGLPPAPFNGSMTFPCEMSLRTIGGRMQVCASPVAEIASLYTEVRQEENVSLPYRTALAEGGYDIGMELEGEAGASVQISVFGLRLELCWSEDRLVCGELTAPLCAEKGRVRLRLLLDTTGAEIYLGQGQSYVSYGRILDYNLSALDIAGQGASLASLRIAALAPVW